MILAVTAVLSLSSGFVAALAQPAAGTATRLRGTIEAVSPDSLELTLRSGAKAGVKLPPGLRVTWVTQAKLAEVTPGSYVGTAAVAQPDGTLKALELQVFPPAMRGVGEGTHAWDLGADSSMTNGTVGDVVVTHGRMMTITYKGGEKQVLVPDDVPVVTYVPTDRSALTAGAHVLINGSRAADGTVTAGSVSVGKDGLVPPM
jgi:hypothetical protein